MDFVGVPAGTTDAEALVLRGPDHDLELAAADSFLVVLGNTLMARNAAGGLRLVPFSSVSGMLTGLLFSRDAAVLGVSWSVAPLMVVSVCVCVGVKAFSILYTSTVRS